MMNSEHFQDFNSFSAFTCCVLNVLISQQRWDQTETPIAQPSALTNISREHLQNIKIQSEIFIHIKLGQLTEMLMLSNKLYWVAIVNYITCTKMSASQAFFDLTHNYPTNVLECLAYQERCMFIIKTLSN